MCTNRKSHKSASGCQNNSHFVRKLAVALPLSCEISGALHLAQPGLMAGRQTDRTQVKISKISKLAVG